MDWKERIYDLSVNYGLSDKEVSHIIFNEFNFIVSSDTVRYHARRKHKKGTEVEYKAINKISKALIINDLHIPFHREEVIIDIILKHRDDIGIIIFNGDIMDCESISVFPKEYRIPLIEEMIVVHKLLRKIDRLTPNIKKVMIRGNHELRFASYKANKQNELNPLHSDNIIETIANGFTHYDKLKKKKTIYKSLGDNFEVINNWYYQYNDLILAHPLNFARVPLKTATSTVEYFLKAGFTFNALFIGHTHKLGSVKHFGKWCGELGCLCYQMDYAKRGNINYSNQDYGYAVFTFTNGMLDRNKSEIFELYFKEGEDVWEEKEVEKQMEDYQQRKNC